MAHLLDSMMSVRSMPWHGLGVVLDEYPASWDEARKLAGLDWEPVSVPMFRRVPVVNEDGTLGVTYEEVAGQQLIERSDNGVVLAARPESYEIFPNKDLGPLVEAVLQQGGGQVQYETAGSLDEGRRVWALIRASEPFEVPGDPRGATLPFVSIQNSHDGSGALRVQRTSVRIVCANTSAMADADAEKTGMVFKFRHTAKIHDRVEIARRVLSGMDHDRVAYLEWAASLMSLRVSERGQQAFVEMLIPMPVGEVITDRVRTNIEKARDLVWGYLRSETCDGIDRTAYGLTQAGIEFLDHGRKSRNAESKFNRTMLRAEPMKAQVERMARECALI